MHVNDLQRLLTDDRYEWSVRLLMLTGLRGEDLDRAAAAGALVRLAPAVCAAGAIAGGLARSPVMLGILAVTALVGAVSTHHPVERVGNAMAKRLGRPTLPAHRAGRRAGCVIGTVVLTAATVSMALGAVQVGAAVALAFGALAALIAVTNVCVPSILLTLVAGAEACTRPVTRRPGRAPHPPVGVS